MAEDTTVYGYSQDTVVKALTVAAFLFFLPLNPVLALVAAGGVYKYAGDYLSEGEVTETETEEVPWRGETNDGSGAVVGETRTVEGPSGEVLTLVPEGMGSFEKTYGVYVTSKRPVTVELESPEATPFVRLVRAAASFLGLEETPLLRRFVADAPRTVKEEAVWRVRNDLDTRLLAEDAPDGRFRCGTCTVEAADSFDGFTYSVEYAPEYVSE